MKIISLFFIISFSLFAQLKYEDISKEHWAYSNINSLVEKGILKENRFNFDGTKSLTRYDFAYTLSRTLDYIDLNKASKNDLEILETLISEFSQELNKIGFDATTFNSRINNVNENIEILKNRVSENEKTIEALKERINKLENKL